MTNEKAIYFLDKRKKELLEKQDSKEGFEFIKALAEIRSLEMAIKALEQQPCIEDYPTCTESEIIKEVIVMLLNHIRTDGQLAHFSFSEVRWLEAMKKKLTSGGEEDGEDSACS